MNFTLNGATYHSAPHPHFTTDQHEIWHAREDLVNAILSVCSVTPCW